MRSGKDFNQRSDWVPETGGGNDRPNLRVILLDDLSFGQSVQAAVTEPEQDNEVQRIEFQGTITGGTFTVTFSGQTTAAIDWNATADGLKTALEALSNIDPGDVVVTKYEGLYVVEFIGQYEAVDVPLMTITNSLTGTGNAIVVANTIWTDTGRTKTVFGMLSHGTPTPMKAGAAALVSWYNGLGYGVNAIECRDLGLADSY